MTPGKSYEFRSHSGQKIETAVLARSKSAAQVCRPDSPATFTMSSPEEEYEDEALPSPAAAEEMADDDEEEAADAEEEEEEIADAEEEEELPAAPTPPVAAPASPPPGQPSDVVLFERVPSRSTGMNSNRPASAFAAQSSYMMTPGDQPGSSLFDRYASESTVRAFARNSQTLTSRLRSTGIKLGCYLNTEANSGRAYTVHLPEACDTMGEVMSLIQRKMQLDNRMLYAAELYLPNGEKLASFKALADAAALDTGIVVGCGEPFDHSTVPQSILSFHTHGGGRAAAKTVKKELATKKMRAAQLKADQVRASGHGLSSTAAHTAKVASVSEKKESAAVMRHDYMNQLIARSAQQNELIRHVQANNAKLRSDRARREAAQKSVWSQDRLQDLAEHRRRESNTWREKQDTIELNAARRVDHAKRVRMVTQAEGKLAKSQLSEQRKAAGLERRMSYISRSVEKAAQEQDLIRAHQVKRNERKSLHLGMRSPSSSHAGSVQNSHRSVF